MTLMPCFSPAAFARERMAEAVIPLRPMMRATSVFSRIRREADGVSLRGFRNAQFRLFRVLHELQGDQLQVLADLFYGRMHEGKYGLFS